MLIPILALVLVVAYLASKPMPGETGLPQPPTIPATGTDGVPSPANSPSSIAATTRGKLALTMNSVIPTLSYPKAGAPPTVPTNVASSVPQGPPDQSKSLNTQASSPFIIQLQSSPVGYGRKL